MALGMIDLGAQDQTEAKLFLGNIKETPKTGTLLNPTSGSLKGDLNKRVYIPKGSPLS